MSHRLNPCAASDLRLHLDPQALLLLAPSLDDVIFLLQRLLISQGLVLVVAWFLCGRRDLEVHGADHSISSSSRDQHLPDKTSSPLAKDQPFVLGGSPLLFRCPRQHPLLQPLVPSGGSAISHIVSNKLELRCLGSVPLSILAGGCFLDDMMGVSVQDRKGSLSTAEPHCSKMPQTLEDRLEGLAQARTQLAVVLEEIVTEVPATCPTTQFLHPKQLEST